MKINLIKSITVGMNIRFVGFWLLLGFSNIGLTDTFTPLFFNTYDTTAESGDSGRTISEPSASSSPCYVEDGAQSNTFSIVSRPPVTASDRCWDVSNNGLVVGWSDPDPLFGNAQAIIKPTTGYTLLGWIEVLPNPASNFSTGNAISDDGAVVVGSSTVTDIPTGFKTDQAFRRTASSGMVGLGYLPVLAGKQSLSRAYDVSADGTKVVGESWSLNTSSDFTPQAFIWTDTSGVMVGLPGLNAADARGVANAVSNDGNIVAGRSVNISGNGRSVKWTNAVGVGSPIVVDLGIDGEARAISVDGTVVGGTYVSSSRAFIHTDDDGVVDVLDHLNGLPTSLAVGWELNEVTGISLNGGIATVVGKGINPSGSEQGWRAEINLTPVIGGDINLDGNVTQGDAILLERYLLDDISLNPQQLNNADISSNGIIDLGDLFELQQLLLDQ